MTGNPSTEPAYGSRVDGDGRKFPWQLGFSVLAWVILGAVLIVAALSATDSTSGADQASIDTIRNALGESSVAVAKANAAPTLWLILGAVVLLLSLLLLLGQGWTRHVLAVLGVVSVIAFALHGRWEAVVAFAALVLGAVPLLAPSAHRYLSGR